MSSMKAIYEIYLFLMHPKSVQIHKIRCLHKANLHTSKGDRGSTFSVDLKFVPLLAFHTYFILFQHFKAIRFSSTPKGLASTRTHIDLNFQ